LKIINGCQRRSPLWAGARPAPTIVIKMSKFVVDLNSPKSAKTSTAPPEFGEYQDPEKPTVFFKVLKILGIALGLILIIGTIGGYFYWQSLKRTPQYSLALIVDAARRDDQQTIDALVDTDAAVDDFMPQITGKAVELYGRNLPPATIARIAQVAAPVLPVVKQRARAEIPNLIREKTKKFESVPFWAIVIGADRFLDITQEADKAFVKSKLNDKPLELTLKRSGDRWQIVGLKDEELAKRIAEKIGQEIIALAKNGGVGRAGANLGVENLQEVLKQAQDIFK
jgi:hypothetical protein